LKRSFRLKFAISLVAVLLAIAPPSRSFAQAEKPTQPQGPASSYEKMDAPETNSEEEGYRHSAAVQAIAKYLHTDTETATQIFEDFNSAVLILAIAGFLIKVLPKAFRKRSETISKELAEARSATEDANKRLSAVEARLAKLDTEIEAIRRQTEQEIVEDEKRIKAQIEEERKRIIESAEQEIEAFSAAAQRDLKKFAADLAVERALQRIHLGADADRILVQNFTSELANTQNSKGGQN
jgi:F-type H+-transporting ATPase subunit b